MMCAPLRVPLLLGLLLGGGGCKELTGSPGLPSGTPNPSFYHTAAGALGMRNAAVFEFEQALPRYVVDAGLITDELEDRNTGASPGALLSTTGVTDPLDERILPAGVTVGSYGELQKVRGFANQALGALATYDTAVADTAAAKVLRGELYGIEGYAEVMLADLFCSGVPLSTLDFQQDFTYAPSSTTAQVYRDAIAKFDTALTLARASDSVVHLAQVGKGRAYLDLGQYAAAADDVTTVPDGFQYQVAVPWSGINTNFLNSDGQGHATVSDREGEHGVPFVSSGDPRTAVTNVGTSSTGAVLYFPTKYGDGLGYAPVTLASSVEARLIQAEAALHATGLTGADTTWLHLLNQLRATAPIPGTTQPDAAALPPLTDPGTPTARVDTLFTERAAWLFLDGHRQGDLRRLLRQYSQYSAFRSQQQVYPTGPYLAPGTGLYGTDVTVPIPSTEFANPLFHGCLDRQP